MPSPFERFSTKLSIQTRDLKPDGLGGWIDTGWTDGVIFDGAVTTDQSMTVRIAEAERPVSKHTLFIPLHIEISEGAIVKNLTTGQYYRVTSRAEDIKTPEFSSMNFKQASAEGFEMTND